MSQMMKKMEQYVSDVRPAFEAVKWEDANVYANWLSQSYYIARRSTWFLGLCLFHAEKYPEFQARCTEHIAEEDGHEKLLINDLKNIGHSLHPELPSAMAFYQPQYFRIVAENPLSFLGYVFFLELLGPTHGEYIMERAVKTDKRSLTFLKVHTRADENHLERALEVTNGLPQQYQDSILTNFLMSHESYTRMLEAIAGSQSKLKKAV